MTVCFCKFVKMKNEVSWTLWSNISLLVLTDYKAKMLDVSEEKENVRNAKSAEGITTNCWSLSTEDSV